MTDVDIWTKLAESAKVAPPAYAPTIPSREEDGKEKKETNWRRVFLVMDVISALFWVYAITKVFVIDVDRVVLDHTFPGVLPVLDYRAFLYLGLLIGISFFAKGKRWMVGYVLAWPLIVVCWRLPWFFIRKRSWALFLGSLQAIFTALSDLKYNLTTKTFALAAALVILTARSPRLLYASGAYVAAILLLSYVRLVKKTFLESSFLAMQRDRLAGLVNSNFVTHMTSLNDDLRSSDIQLYDRSQISAITTNCSLGILMNKGMYYWAYQLERYRKNYSPALIFSAVSYVWLFLGTVLSLALLNEAIIKARPAEYTLVHAHPSFIAVCVYALSTLFVSTSGGIEPSRDLAYAIQLIAGIAGPVFLVTCVLNFFISFKRERDENALRELVAELKRRAREQGDRFNTEWAVSVDEARARLDDIGEGLGKVFAFFTSRVPADFFDDSGANGA
jgi:hypothetical protein